MARRLNGFSATLGADGQDTLWRVLYEHRAAEKA